MSLVERYQLECIYREAAGHTEEIFYLQDKLAAARQTVNDLEQRSRALYQSDQTLASMLDFRVLFFEIIRRSPLFKIVEFYWSVSRFLGTERSDQNTNLTYALAQALTVDRQAKDIAAPVEPTFKEQSAAVDPPVGAGVDNNSLPEPQSFGPIVRPRVLVDVTVTAASSTRTGIQRYVRNFAQISTETGAALPIIIKKGEMYAAYESTKRIHAEPNDHLLLLDANWMPERNDMDLVISEIRRVGGSVVGLFHDVIPLSFPYVCHANTPKIFAEWFDYIMPKLDAVIASTKAGADAIAEQVHKRGLELSSLPVGWVAAPSGLRRQAINAGAEANDTLKKIFSEEPVFMSVGTIEPRKGYQIALDAFNQIWKRNVRVKYLIVGKPGWSMKHFEKQLSRHPEMGKSLFFFDRCTDEELVFGYKHAHRLLASSIEEGFGMPLLEASMFGLPVICSDIAVFREVLAGQRADFFETANVSDLAVKLRDSLDHPPIRQINADTSKLDNVKPMTTMIREELYQGRIRSGVSSTWFDPPSGPAATPASRRMSP